MSRTAATAAKGDAAERVGSRLPRPGVRGNPWWRKLAQAGPGGEGHQHRRQGMAPNCGGDLRFPVLPWREWNRSSHRDRRCGGRRTRPGYGTGCIRTRFGHGPGRLRRTEVMRRIQHRSRRGIGSLFAAASAAGLGESNICGAISAFFRGFSS